MKTTLTLDDTDRALLLACIEQTGKDVASALVTHTERNANAEVCNTYRAWLNRADNLRARLRCDL